MNRKQIIIKISLVLLSVLSIFTILFVINNHNINKEKNIILKEVGDSFKKTQDMFLMNSIKTGEPLVFNPELKGTQILQDASKKLKEKHNISLKDYTSNVIEKDGNVYIELKGYIKSKLFFPSHEMNLIFLDEPEITIEE